MASSNTAPIMTCAKFLHHGGPYAQVDHPPDTRPSLSLRHRLLPAAPRLPRQGQGHRHRPARGRLGRRRARLSSISETCGRLAGAPCEETYAKALYANLFCLEQLKRKVNASFRAHLPRALRRKRKRPLRLIVDLTLIPYYLFANREPTPMQVWTPYVDK